MIRLPDIFDAYMGLWWLLVAITTEELVWVLKAKVNDFVSGLKRAEGEQERLERRTRKAGTGLQRFTLNITKAAGVIAGVFVAALAAGGKALIDWGLSAASMSARTNELRNTFNSMAKSAGESGNKILAAMRKGLGGAVSDMEIFQQANKAMVSGLPASANAMGELARVAAGMAKIMGVDVKEALDRMVGGITKQEIELLDDLFGGSVRFGDILKQLPKDADASARQMAIYNEILRVGKKRIDDAGISGLSFSERIGQARTLITALRTEIGNKLIPTFSALAIKVGEVAEQLRDLISDATANRLEKLGNLDLAESRRASVSVSELQAERAGLRTELQAQRGRTRIADIMGGRLDALNLDEVSQIAARNFDQETKAIQARIRAERELADAQKENVTVFGKSRRELAAEDALNAAREHEEALRAQNDEIQKTLDLMQQIKQVEADIAANRESLTAGELAEVVTSARAPSPAPYDITPAFRNFIPDEPIEIQLNIPEDAVEKARSAGARAAEAAQDAMTRFTDDVPTRFEDNMERAFYSVRNLADKLGGRMGRVFRGAFQAVTGAARLTQHFPMRDGTEDVVPELGKIGKKIESVATAVAPIAGAVGGVLGVMKGLSSLFGNDRRAQAGNVLNPENPLTIEGLREDIAKLNAWLDQVRPLVEEGRASTAVENQYWLNVQRRNDLEAQLSRLLSARSDGGSEEEGNVTYATTITITDRTAKDLVNKISTNSAYLNTLNATIGTLDQTIKTWSPAGGVQASNILSPEAIGAIKSLANYTLLSEEQRAVIDALVADQILTSDERKVLEDLAKYDLLPPDIKAVIDNFLADQVLTQEEIDALNSLLGYTLLSEEERKIIDALTKDQILTDDERKVLENLANYHLLPPDIKAVIDNFLADQVLTQDEIDALNSLLGYHLLSEAEQAVINALVADKVLTEDERRVLENLANYDLLPPDIKAVIDNFLADQVLTQDEIDALNGLLNYSLLTPTQQAVIDALTKDQILTYAELQVLAGLQNYDLLPDAAKTAIQDIVRDGVITPEELTTLQSILAGEIPPIEIEEPPVITVQMPPQDEIASVFAEAIAQAVASASEGGGIVRINIPSGPINFGDLGGSGLTDWRESQGYGVE